MANFDRAIESIIQNAIERGAFDNLKGEGKPLNLHQNPLASEDWRMAYSILEQEGFALPWMEERKSIEAALKIAQGSLKRTWDWCEQRLAAGDHSPAVEQEWRQAQARFSESVRALNKRIEAYNLQIPADVFYRPFIQAQKEIELIGKV